MVKMKGFGSTAPAAIIGAVAVEALPTIKPIQLLTGTVALTATAMKCISAANLSLHTFRIGSSGRKEFPTIRMLESANLNKEAGRRGRVVSNNALDKYVSALK